MCLCNCNKLNKDEQELFDLLIAYGLKKVISMAKEKSKKENDTETFIYFLVEIQNLFVKLGYDFQFKIRENKKDEV